ncbi:uncharacterized protein [Procambarus clarkii]|uniref:uncharacterized protein n=1 Tax=Procambarus clarkii TaxID=6728 RepID=UPI003742E4FE
MHGRVAPAPVLSQCCDLFAVLLLRWSSYMQDNGSSVNKIPTNNIDVQEDINISEGKENNGEQELKLKKMKKNEDCLKIQLLKFTFRKIKIRRSGKQKTKM